MAACSSCTAARGSRERSSRRAPTTSGDWRAAVGPPAAASRGTAPSDRLPAARSRASAELPPRADRATPPCWRRAAAARGFRASRASACWRASSEALRLPLGPGRQQSGDDHRRRERTRGRSRVARSMRQRIARRGLQRATPHRARRLSPASPRRSDEGHGHGRTQGPAPREPARAEQRGDRTTGTYQVQSISECAPNTTTRQSMLSMPMRSGVYGSGKRFPAGPRPGAELAPRPPAGPASVERVGRPSRGGHPRDEQGQRQRQPDQAQVGERLHHEAVRVPDFQGLLSIALASGLVARCADPDRRVGRRRSAAPPSSNGRGRSPPPVRRSGVFGGGFAFGLGQRVDRMGTRCP